MATNLSWIDFSAKDRRRMLDVVALFRERDTRDELGLGSIRDAFAEELFPGTSTIQTRARYMLFVPWIYKRLEDLKVPSGKIAERARQDEIYLINSLKSGGESEGVIGIEAGNTLQRLPSSVYWYGLGRWGIRKYQGSRAQYHRSLDSFYRRSQYFQTDDTKEPIFGEVAVNWDPGLPEAPDRLLYETDFGLPEDESSYLLEKIQFYCKGSLLAHLVYRTEPAGKDVEFIWMHPEYGSFPQRLREIVDHGRRFSEVLHGAALLYNLLLSEKGGYSDWRDDYLRRLEEWAAKIEAERNLIEAWDLEGFWKFVGSAEYRVGYRTQRFIMAWIELVGRSSSAVDIVDKSEARALVEEREVSLKRSRARLRDEHRLARWGGSSGSAPLEYRWTTARMLVNDILIGMGKG